MRELGFQAVKAGNKSRENERRGKNQSKSLQTSTTKPHREEQGGNIRRKSTSPWRATQSSSKPLWAGLLKGTPTSPWSAEQTYWSVWCRGSQMRSERVLVSPPSPCSCPAPLKTGSTFSTEAPLPCLRQPGRTIDHDPEGWVMLEP